MSSDQGPAAPADDHGPVTEPQQNQGEDAKAPAATSAETAQPARDETTGAPSPAQTVGTDEPESSAGHLREARKQLADMAEAGRLDHQLRGVLYHLLRACEIEAERAPA